MIKVMKNHGKTVQVYRLGEDSEEIGQLIKEKKIIPLPDNKFEVKTSETLSSQSEHGQIAMAGDFVKVDSDGNPYPNCAEWFYQNHRHLAGNEYEQIPQALDAWTCDEKMCKEIEFLIQHKGLVINEQEQENYFTAPLWGTTETAGKDAVVVFYGITYTESGEIVDADFNFVKRTEFDKTYHIIEQNTEQNTEQNH